MIHLLLRLLLQVFHLNERTPRLSDVTCENVDRTHLNVWIALKHFDVA